MSRPCRAGAEHRPGFDDGLVLAEQGVDHHAVAALADCMHDHNAALRAAEVERVERQRPQADHRQHLAAQLDDAGARRPSCIGSGVGGFSTTSTTASSGG